MRNKVKRKPRNDRRWKVQSTCSGAWMCLRRYLSKYRTATFSWWSFLERANRAWGLLNWHWEWMMVSPWHRSRIAHSKACIFGVQTMQMISCTYMISFIMWGLRSPAHYVVCSACQVSTKCDMFAIQSNDESVPSPIFCYFFTYLWTRHVVSFSAW